MKNKVEIKKGTVRKTFSGRLDFVMEAKLYTMLKGTGLAPELIDAHDGCIEHEYVEGETFLKLLTDAENSGNTPEAEALLAMFCSWYKKFRDITRLTLGTIRFDKFIVSGDRLCYIDFENCRPGYAEQDFAGFASRIALESEPMSDRSVELAKRFISWCSPHIDLIPDLLAMSIPKELARQASEMGIFLSEAQIEYFKTVLTCAAGVLTGGKTSAESMAECCRSMPLFTAPLVRDDIPGCIAELQSGVSQPWMLILSTDDEVPPAHVIKALLSARKDELAAVTVKQGDAVMQFPLLLNTERTAAVIRHSREEGKTSLPDILSNMRVFCAETQVK